MLLKILRIELEHYDSEVVQEFVQKESQKESAGLNHIFSQFDWNSEDLYHISFKTLFKRLIAAKSAG